MNAKFIISLNINGKAYDKTGLFNNIETTGLNEEDIDGLMYDMQRLMKESYLDMQYEMRGSDGYKEWKKTADFRFW